MLLRGAGWENLVCYQMGADLAYGRTPRLGVGAGTASLRAVEGGRFAVTIRPKTAAARFTAMTSNACQFGT